MVRAGALRRVAASPIGRCVVAGALLFAAERVWTARGGSEPASLRAPIPISPVEIAAWREERSQRQPRAADPSADAAWLEGRIDDEVLLREALARGFDQQDGAVRQRLLKLGEYLGVAPPGDGEALEREARSLGLELSDLALRRHLIEMMRLAAAKTKPADLPSEGELQAYYLREGARFAPPAAIRLTHVYLSRARRGAGAEREAAALLDALRSGQVDALPGLGDPFARGAAIGPLSAERLDAIFGPGFAEAIGALPVGRWSGPVRSSYGFHLVRVDEVVPGVPPAFAAVRGRLLHEVLRARSAQHLDDTMRALRARYAVDVDRGGAGLSALAGGAPARP